MSDNLSTYKAELVDRYLQNQISNSEKDTLHALLQHNRSAHTATERDIFAQLTLWVLLHAPARETTSPRENVNVKVHASVPLEGIRTLEASEQAQKSAVDAYNKLHNTYYIHKEANTYTIKRTVETIPNQPETNNMQFTMTNFNGKKGFTFPKFDKHPSDNAVSIIREDGTIIGATFFDGKTCWVCPAIDPLLRDAIKKQARNHYVVHNGEDKKLSDVQRE